MKKTLGAILTLLAVGLAAADGYADTTQYWSLATALKVSQVDVENLTENPGQQFIKFSSEPLFFHYSKHNCSDTSGWWNIGGNQAGVDSLRATALAAKVANRSVKILWIGGGGANSFTSCAGGGPNGTDGLPVVRGIQIL